MRAHTHAHAHSYFHTCSCIFKQLDRLKTHYLMVENPSAIIKAERKLLLVPLVFIILRIWDIFGDTYIVYAHHDVPKNDHNWVKLFTVSYTDTVFILYTTKNVTLVIIL